MQRRLGAGAGAAVCGARASAAARGRGGGGGRRRPAAAAAAAARRPGRGRGAPVAARPHWASGSPHHLHPASRGGARAPGAAARAAPDLVAPARGARSAAAPPELAQTQLQALHGLRAREVLRRIAALALRGGEDGALRAPHRAADGATGTPTPTFFNFFPMAARPAHGWRARALRAA
jgi:hypothetical protein